MIFDAQRGVVYYASAQAIDGGMPGSVFGEEISFVYQGARIEVIGSSALTFDPAYYQHLSAPQQFLSRMPSRWDSEIIGRQGYSI